jgi:hypothetical protein
VHIPDPDSEEGGREPDDDAATEDEKEADDAATEAGSDIPIRTEARIYRSHPMLGNKEALVDVVAARQFTGGASIVDFCRESYGGGDYRVEFYGPTKGKEGHRGKGRLPGRARTFKIDPTIPPRHPMAVLSAGAAGGNPPAVASGGGGGGLDQAVALLVIDIIKQGQEMQRQHSALLTAQLEALRADRTPDRDPLEMFKGMVELMRPREEAQSPMAQLRELLEVQQLIQPSGGRESALGVLAELGPKVLETVNEAMKRQPAAQPAAQPATLHDADGRALGEVPQAGGAVNIKALLGPWAPRLVKWAQQGRPAGWVAETVYWEVPQGLHPHLEAALAPDGVTAELIATYPALGQWPDWLAEIRTEVLSLLHGGEDDTGAGAETADNS